MSPPPHRRVPSSAVLRFLDPSRFDALLARLVPDAEERAFVVRCVLGEGPAHHRGASYVLVSLLGELAARRGARPRSGGPSVAVPMRLPPHLAAPGEESEFPLRMPTGALARLSGNDAAAEEAMIDCLTDGPPHHALANAIMICLLDALLAEEPGEGGP